MFHCVTDRLHRGKEKTKKGNKKDEKTALKVMVGSILFKYSLLGALDTHPKKN